ncbi:hypothetical protein BG006_010142 [Podila minutissima]|uniref:Wax synthase domain-containing protein n=1 Tax=Podila minutissima TaxID=64525 RepID=A0A9P5SDJ4_9FUNG|nr:hypothetical protein BG006_010142 [Podila minutissima]
MVPFVLSFLLKKQVLSLSWFPRSLVTIAVAASIIYYISLLNYTLMIVWAAVTGDLVRHYFPGFATLPAEFWRHKYVTSKDVVPKAVVQSLEMGLPIMGVFLMSGLMHEFMVVGMWHEQFGYMTAFFMNQGVATILSKVLQQSVGKRVQVRDWC